MLTELKQELEYCREKWEKAKRKNNESDLECRKLRKEFAARKKQSLARDSGESGYSDEQNESADDRDGCDADRSSTPSPVDFYKKTITTSKEPEAIPIQESSNTCTTSEDTGTTFIDRLLSSQEDYLAVPAPVEEAATLPSETDIRARAETEASERERVARNETEADSDRERSSEARAFRLKNLEEQCQLLVIKVDITTQKSNFLSDRLEELHDHYGIDRPIASTSTSITHGTITSRDKDQPCSSAQAEDTDKPGTEEINTVESPELSLAQPPEECLVIVASSSTNDDANPCNVIERIPVEPSPSPSTSTSTMLLASDFDRRMAERAERLKRLEQQCTSLIGKMTNTVERSDGLSARMQEIHEDCLSAETRHIHNNITRREPNISDTQQEAGINAAETTESDQQESEGQLLQENSAGVQDKIPPK